MHKGNMRGKAGAGGGPRSLPPTELVVDGNLPEKLLEPQASTIPEPISDARYDLLTLQALRRIIRAVDLHSRKLSAQLNITGPQLVCLLSIEEHEPITPSGIARHVHLSPSTVIGILDRLSAKGLIQRERDLQDRRLVQVSLTGHGKELVRNAPSPLQDTLAEAMNELPMSEQARIVESLERVVAMMQVRELDAAPILETGPIAQVAKIKED